MDTKGWSRIAAASGILTVVIQIIGLAIHGYPKIGASKSELQAWANATDETRFLVGIYIEALGILIFAFFVAWLFTVVRRAEGSTWLSWTALGSGLVWVAVVLPGNEIWFGLLKAGRAGLDPGLLVVIRDLAQDTFNVSNLPFGLFALVIGAAILCTRCCRSGWVG